MSVSPAPSDPGSGLASIRYQYAPTGTTTWADACTNTKAPWNCNWNSTNVADGVYDLRAVATDQSGNTRVAANAPLTARRIDNTRPAPRAVATANHVGGTVGRVETGDSLGLTFSERVDPASILAGWSGASTNVQVRLTDGTRDRLEVWRADGGARLALASSLSLGGDYVPASGATFNATMVQDGAVITVTLGTLASGAVRTVAVTGGTLSWTADPAVLDLAGLRVTNTAATGPGPAF
jgi:hypothetical protein